MKYATLGALAAGFGLVPLAHGQATAPDAQLPAVRAKATAEPAGKDGVQATTTRIGKGTQDVRDVPQSLTVVTEKLIDDRNLDTLKDALRNTAGITFLAAEGGEEDIRLRGFPLQATGDVFVDGLRDPAFYDRDTFFMDRIEVLRGSASMLFGRGSTGGAVNQVTKTARLLDENQLDLTLGSHAYRRLVGDFNLRTGESAALRFGTMVTKADSNGAGSRIDKKGVAGTLRWGIGERDEFSVTGTWLDNDNGMNYGMPWISPSAGAPVERTTLLPVDPDSYYGMSSDRNAGTAGALTFTHTHRFADRSELTTKLRRGLYERDQRAGTVRLCTQQTDPVTGVVTNPQCPVTSTLDAFGPSTELTRGTQLKIQNLQTTFVQSDWSGRFQAGGMTHEVQAGIDLAQEAKQVWGDSPMNNVLQGSGTLRLALYRQLGIAKPNTSAGTPDDGAWIDESKRQLFRTSDYESDAQGVYVQDLVEFTPGWKLLAGLRYDHLVGDYVQHLWNYTPPDGSAGYQYFSSGGDTSYRMKVSEWSKRLGLLWQPDDRLSFHLSGATSFNTSGDAYSLSAGNAGVPPEQSINLELGGRWEAADGKLSLRGAVFRTTKLHERNTDPLVTDLVTLSGKRHASGIDVDVAGRITPQWEVFASFMWLPVATIDEGVPGSEGEGTRPSLTPKRSGTLWTTYQLTPRLRVGGGLNARSSQTPNRNPGWKAPGWVTGDLMAEYALLQDQLTLKLNVSNVTNKLYADSLYTGHYIPGAGRLVMLTGSLKF